MTFQGAVIREQGITFAVVIVKKHVVNVRSEADDLIRRLQPLFGGVPAVLMSQDHKGTPTYYGRKDIVRFLSKVPLSAIPWRQYELN